jgi:hypothetical protein
MYLLANMILENMNLSVDPCEDFYQFNCGGYVERTRFDDQELAVNQYNQLENKLNFRISGYVKKFYI